MRDGHVLVATIEMNARSTKYFELRLREPHETEIHRARPPEIYIVDLDRARVGRKHRGLAPMRRRPLRKRPLKEESATNTSR